MKKLYRSKTNRKLAGVFGGLAEVYDVDATLLRLGWILITVFTGFVPGIIAYILAVAVMPEGPHGASSGRTGSPTSETTENNNDHNI